MFLFYTQGVCFIDPHIYVDLGTESPNLYTYGGPGVPKIGSPHNHITLANFTHHLHHSNKDDISGNEFWHIEINKIYQ